MLQVMPLSVSSLWKNSLVYWLPHRERVLAERRGPQHERDIAAWRSARVAGGRSRWGICTMRGRPLAGCSEGAAWVLLASMKAVIAAAGMNRQLPMMTLASSPSFNRS